MENNVLLDALNSFKLIKECAVSNSNSVSKACKELELDYIQTLIKNEKYDKEWSECLEDGEEIEIGIGKTENGDFEYLLRVSVSVEEISEDGGSDEYGNKETVNYYLISITETISITTVEAEELDIDQATDELIIKHFKG